MDFSKAFDCVNYWKLFKQLLDDGVNVSIVRLLPFWYENQSISLLWNNTKSSSFTVGNGIKRVESYLHICSPDNMPDHCCLLSPLVIVVVE